MELKYGQPFDLLHWSEQNQDKLTPPVCNTALFPDGDFIINMVGGPNKRTDFHCNPTEEIFYQIKGNAYLNIWDRGQFEQIRLNEGDIFLLPAYLNHSPQRPEAGGLCFLVEKPRAKEQKDAFNWYCANCATLVGSVGDHVDDLVADLPSAFKLFYDKSDDERTCPQCGEVHPGRKAGEWLQRFAEVHKPKYA